MSEQTLKRLAAVLGVLALAYAGTWVSQRGSGSTGTDGSGVERLFEGLSVDRLNEVTFTGPSDTVVLARSDQALWTANGYATDSTGVRRFIESLTDLRVAGVASTNPDNHGRLGLDEAGAWSVTFGSEANAPVVLVGNQSQRFQSFYARLPNEEVAVTVEGDFRTMATRALSAWRDRTVVRLDTTRVARIELTRDGTSRSLVRADSGWTAGGADIDAPTIAAVLSELANLSASGFAADTAVLGAEDARSLVVLDTRGETMTDLSASREGTVFRVIRSGSPTVFEVAEFRANRLWPEPDSIG